MCSIFWCFMQGKCKINEFFWDKSFLLIVSIGSILRAVFIFSRDKKMFIFMENKAKKLILLEICLIFLLLRTGHKTYANIYASNFWKAYFFCSYSINLFSHLEYVRAVGHFFVFSSIFFCPPPKFAPNGNLQNDKKSKFAYTMQKTKNCFPGLNESNFVKTFFFNCGLIHKTFLRVRKLLCHICMLLSAQIMCHVIANLQRLYADGCFD